eukprot:6434689-Prymnesium_polylepis.1
MDRSGSATYEEMCDFWANVMSSGGRRGAHAASHQRGVAHPFLSVHAREHPPPCPAPRFVRRARSAGSCVCCGARAGNYEEAELLEELDNILKGEGWTDFDDGRTT